MQELPNLENELEKIYQIETTENIKLRCKKFLDNIYGNNGKIIIVTHGGTMSAFMKYMFRLNWYLPHGHLNDFGNCKIMVVQNVIEDFYMISEANNEHLLINQFDRN